MMRYSFVVTLVALAGCASAAGGPAAAEPNAGGGHLVIVGGGPIPEAINRRFFELAGGVGKARIVVLPMASAGGAKSGAEKAAAFARMGAASAVSM